MTSRNKLAEELISAYLHEGFTFEELCEALKHDILLADRVLFPFSPQLSAHQQATFLEYEEGKFAFHQACRGAAKSYSTARYMLLKALTWLMTGIFTAPTFRQALLAFKYAIAILSENSTARNPINLARELDGKITGGGGSSVEARMKFKNGSILKALPMGQGERLRGERADILYCDEFYQMDQTLFKVHILPFLYKPIIENNNPYVPKRLESKLIMTTSAEYEDCFAYHFLTHTMLPKVAQQEKEGGRRKYIVIDWNIDDLNACGFPLEPDIIELQTGNAPTEEKQRALYNKWTGISGQFFPGNIAEKIARPDIHIEHESDPRYSYALTVDVAISATGDDFIIHVFKFLGDRQMAFVNSFRATGLSPDDMAFQIHQFNNAFKPEIIYMDKGGGGLAVVSSLAKRKLVMSSNQEVPIDSPILLYDEVMLSGQKKLVLNRPADSRVKEALMGDRPTGQEYIAQEEVVLHLMYDGFKLLLGNEPPVIFIPEFASEKMDNYYRSEIEILDNIRESIHQLRHLAVKTIELADGTREVVRSPRTKVPMYVWKNSKKDGAIAFCYAYIPYMLHYQYELGEQVQNSPMIIQPNYYGNEWLIPFLND